MRTRALMHCARSAGIRTASFSGSHRGLPAVAPRFLAPLGRRWCSEEVSRDQMEYDILIVGGGPAGLSAAIRAKQVAAAKGEEIEVCVVDKGSEIGSHILSGNVFEPRALDELIPDWKEKGAPLETEVTADTMYWLINEKYSVPIPTAIMALSPQMNQHGNYIVSLGVLCKWLAEQAEELGVEIYSGFAANEPVYNEGGALVGVQLRDVGVGKDGKKKDIYEAGMELLGKQTVIAEGCRGSLSEAIMKKYNLREGVCPQHYGLGVKEVWEIPPEKFAAGTVTHTVGWPLDQMMYGGSFIYHMKPNLLHIGMVVGLDYTNPYVSPYQEFQRFKHHPRVQSLLEGGTCISYGARVLNEGGYQAIPKLTFPGGMLAGCSAGFLNVPKIKGSHTAMKTGMLAGEAAVEALMAAGEDAGALEIKAYEDSVRSSWVWEELKQVRNFKPAWKYGMFGGLGYGGFTLLLTRGKEPWTFKWNKRDCDYTKEASQCKEIEYPKADGKISFDLLDNLVKSGVNHAEDQPAHLRVKEEEAATPLEVSFPKFAGPEGRFCPAKVYEYVPDEAKGDGAVKLVINAQNCVHCKCCSIKTPNEFINWTVPEGGGGPQYGAM